MATRPGAAARVNVSDEFNALMARIDGISNILRDNANQAETAGDLTDEVARVLRETGALKVAIPRELGGYEFSPSQLIETIIRVSYEDASAGWAFLSLLHATGTTAASLEREAARELFPDVENDRYALVAGQQSTHGSAVRVDDGYRVTSRGHFASRISLASYVYSTARCVESGRDLGFTLPKEQVTLLESWNLTGLHATHSVDYTCDDVFVPDRMSHTVAAAPHTGGAIYRMSPATIASVCHTGWVLGVGRRMLDEMRELAAQDTSAPNAAIGQYHAEYASAESALRAARAWAMDIWADNESTLDRGEHLNAVQETLTRLMTQTATRATHTTGELVYQWAGTPGLQRTTLQRFLRDLHTGFHHLGFGPVLLQECGRSLSELSPDFRRSFLA